MLRVHIQEYNPSWQVLNKQHDMIVANMQNTYVVVYNYYVNLCGNDKIGHH